MATLKTLLHNSPILILKSPVLSSNLQGHGMSQYPSYYIKPVYTKEEQQDLQKNGESIKLVHVPTRAALNDHTCAVYHDPLINLFINYVMKDGVKILAKELVDKTLEKIKRIQLEKYHKAQTSEEQHLIELNSRKIFHSAILNAKPLLQLTPIKRGGVTYQVPVPITDQRSQFLSMKWFIEAGKEKERTMRFYDKLAIEIIDASNNIGRVVKRKQELHKQCEANRAYAHYRWS